MIVEMVFSMKLIYIYINVYLSNIVISFKAMINVQSGFSRTTMVYIRVNDTLSLPKKETFSVIL